MSTLGRRLPAAASFRVYQRRLTPSSPRRHVSCLRPVPHGLVQPVLTHGRCAKHNLSCALPAAPVPMVIIERSCLASRRLLQRELSPPVGLLPPTRGRPPFLRVYEIVIRIPRRQWQRVLPVPPVPTPLSPRQAAKLSVPVMPVFRLALASAVERPIALVASDVRRDRAVPHLELEAHHASRAPTDHHSSSLARPMCLGLDVDETVPTGILYR